MRRTFVFLFILFFSLSLLAGKKKDEVPQEQFSATKIPFKSYENRFTEFLKDAVENKTSVFYIKSTTSVSYGSKLDDVVEQYSYGTIKYSYVTPSKQEYDEFVKKNPNKAVRFTLLYSNQDKTKTVSCVHLATVANQEKLVDKFICKGSDLNGYVGYVDYSLDKELSTEAAFNKFLNEYDNKASKLSY